MNIYRTTRFEPTRDFLCFHITQDPTFHVYSWTHITPPTCCHFRSIFGERPEATSWLHPSSRTSDRSPDGVFFPASILATISGRTIQQTQRVHQTSGRKCPDQFDHKVRTLHGRTSFTTRPRQTWPNLHVHHLSGRQTRANQSSPLLTRALWGRRLHPDRQMAPMCIL